jgi:hypothetical protein
MKFPKSLFWIPTASAVMAVEKQRIKQQIEYYELQLYATKERIKQLKKELKGY